MTMSSTPDDIRAAADVLRAGGLVAFPTETVYGLGADAANTLAVERIFAVKGRPSGHPLIVHIESAEQMTRWAREVPPAAQCLAAAFWPGPMTLILKRAQGAGDAAAGGLDTIGLRVPSHPMARALLTAFGGGVAGPSANRFGRISPTTAAHVLEEFTVGVNPVPVAPAAESAAVGLEAVPPDARPRIDAVLDGGATEVGLESTIIELTRGAPVILRPGRISEEAVARALEAAGIVFEAGVASGAAPAAPGTLDSHYAPRAAMRLLPRRDFTDVLSRQRGQRIAVLALEVSVPRVPVAVTRILPASAMLYARGLYAALRDLDALGADLILVETPPSGPLWAAVNDRLRRAAHDHAIGSRAERHTQVWKGRKPGVVKAAEVGADADGPGLGESGPDGGLSATRSESADDTVDGQSD